MKNITSGIAFLLMLAAAATLLLIGNDGTNDENRSREKLPQFSRETYVSGEFASGVNAYVNDRIAFRNELIDASHALMSYKGTSTPDGTVIRAELDIGTGRKKSSDILVKDGKIMELFEKNTDLFDKYADIINSYAEQLDNTRVFSAIIPTQLEFQEPMYANLQDSQHDAINYIYDRLDKRIEKTDMYSALVEHKEEYIYFLTDHHWTARGAYYGYKEFCTTAGVSYVDINDFEMQTTDEFDGYLSRFVKNSSAKAGKDTFEWYNTDKDNKISYAMRSYNEDGSVFKYTTPIFYTERNDYDFFLGADHPMAIYTNPDLRGGRTILIVSDSFVNAFTPWLVKSYYRVVLINPRSYLNTLQKAAAEFKPDDVLILNYIFAPTFDDFCNDMERIGKEP